MRVTFDTNTLDKVVRPELFPKDPRRSEFRTIHTALAAHRVLGAFSVTIITIEGIKKVDRASVFGSSRLTPRPDVVTEAGDGTTNIRIELVAEQSARSPLDPAFSARVNAAVKFGLRMLGAPRIGMLRIEDPDKSLYWQDADEEALALRLDRYHVALRNIESRGLGHARLKRLTAGFAARDGVKELWFRSLQRAKDIHEERAVERGFAEWSDADSIAAHIGYGLDFFCTEDQGNTGGEPSIFDATNRQWLEETYGVKFVTLTELAEILRCNRLLLILRTLCRSWRDWLLRLGRLATIRGQVPFILEALAGRLPVSTVVAGEFRAT